MRYEGPIYRPPSEADSLLIQATVGCPHNLCTFCMVYKQGVKFKVERWRPSRKTWKKPASLYGTGVRTLFFPAGNTIAMPTPALAEICRYSQALFPRLERLTVYGSSQYLLRKGPEQLKTLAAAGLNACMWGWKAATTRSWPASGRARTPPGISKPPATREAGIELNAYVILGLGGRERTQAHARETARVLNAMQPAVVRLRTLVPKVHTPLLADVQAGRFQLLTPHEVLRETMALLQEPLHTHDHRQRPLHQLPQRGRNIRPKTKRRC